MEGVKVQTTNYRITLSEKEMEVVLLSLFAAKVDANLRPEVREFIYTLYVQFLDLKHNTYVARE